MDIFPSPLGYTIVLINFEAQSTFYLNDMNKQKEQLEAIRDIRNLMEKSSRFLSLSGLAGIVIGFAAIVGVAAAYAYMGLAIDEGGYHTLILNKNADPNGDIFLFLLMDLLLVLLFSIATVTIMAIKKAEKQGLPKWDGTAKRLTVQLAVPMLAGTILSIILLNHQLIGFIAPVSLIFYGLALFNASKYTFDDIQYFGIAEILTGLLAAIYIDFGLLFWVFGFGGLHIVYGIRIYFKYEK